MESYDREAERVIHLVDVTPEMKKSVMEGQVMFRIKERKKQLEEAEKFIEESLQGKKRNKQFQITLPKNVTQRIKSVIGRDFDTHSLDANSFIHARKNHGVDGLKLTTKSIPLRNEDFKLAPYIMVAPDRVVRGMLIRLDENRYVLLNY